MIPLRPPSSPQIVRADLPDLQAVISGGQTGADQAGLRAARRLGLATGGYAPRGWMTTAGPDRSLADFGLVQHPAWGYPQRTKDNVKAADATIRIAVDFGSPGERCTLNAIAACRKPRFDIKVTIHNDTAYDTTAIHADGIDKLNLGLVPGAALFIKFLIHHKIKILNVAGNSEATSPGIGAIAEAFLVEALSMKEKS